MKPLHRIIRLHIFKSSKWSRNFSFFPFNRKGFLTVEAAIFLPIFIIGVLTFAYLMKFVAIQERVFHSMTDEARILCAEAGLNPLAPLFELKLKDRIYDENGKHVSELELAQFGYRYPAHGMTDMISMDLNYHVDINLPIPFYDTLPVSESLLCRGFVGYEEQMDSLPFCEMEQEKDSNLVWIFPRAGGRYHAESCIHITSEPRQMTMSAQIRGKYETCSICSSKNLPDGSLVYCFRTGESYHTGNCPIVDKYVISIEKEEAVQKGYTACSKCGGD